MILPGFGELGQRRLCAARVLVIGAGGLGSACVPYLAGAGVGMIGIVDDDTVELSNLHRQVVHGTADVGRAKTDSLDEFVREMNPNVHVRLHRDRLTSENALEIFAQYDLVIDGSDNFPTRYLANDAAELVGLPLVWGAILQTYGQLGVAWHRYGPGYRDLFPQPPSPDDVVDCGVGGVLPGLCGTVGSLLATEAMKLITGIGDPLIGRVLVYNSLTARMSEVPYRRDPHRQPVRKLIDYEAFCARSSNVPTRISAVDLAQQLRAGAALRLIDVRTPEERARLRIGGTESMPLAELEDLALDPSAHDFDGPVVLYCEHDPRSIRAARLLLERGAVEVGFLVGGVRRFATIAPELLESDQR
jgi:molybdopterin/thiamine biosynthesis adenylyltransferase/rhodanese-related sulfurtransferase